MRQTLAVDVGSVSFTVRPDQNAAFWSRVASGDWEPATFHVLDRFLRPGSAFLDVGAWIGPVTLYAAAIGAHCHAYEPDPVARTALLRNLELNPGLADRVVVDARALAGAAGTTRLGNVTSATGGDSMSSLLFADSSIGWPVETISLADAIGDLPEPPALVKIDIEGAEAELLAGSAAYLAEHQPPLCVSVHSRFWSEPIPRLESLAATLSAYAHLYTVDLVPITTDVLFDDEHHSALFELVAVSW